MEAIFPFLFSFPPFPPLLVFLFPVSSSLPIFSPFLILFPYSLYPLPLFLCILSFPLYTISSFSPISYIPPFHYFLFPSQTRSRFSPSRSPFFPFLISSQKRQFYFTFSSSPSSDPGTEGTHRGRQSSPVIPFPSFLAAAWQQGHQKERFTLSFLYSFGIQGASFPLCCVLTRKKTTAEYRELSDASGSP